MRGAGRRRVGARTGTCSAASLSVQVAAGRLRVWCKFTMVTAYIYARVSTEEQAVSGAGLAAQIHIGVTEAIRQGLDHQVVIDDGITGTAAPDSRPALGPLLQSLASDDTLIVSRLDRLDRRTLDVLELADRAQRDGWRLVCWTWGLTPPPQLVG